jgi:hypothetical protein
MFSAHTTTHTLLSMVLVTGIMLAPAALATPAVQNLIDLRTVINAAAATIGDTHNPNLGFGFGLGLGSNGQMGTADLVNNITTTVLQMKFQMDTNKVCSSGLTSSIMTYS